MKQLPYIALIVIFGFIIYANALNNDFIYDDHGLVVDNKYIKDWQFLPKIFTMPLPGGYNVETNFYRPIQALTYLFDYSLFKLKPLGYHLTNILLHLINGILVFLLINMISKNLAVSTISSLLFVIHPIQTEAVTYISGRADPLSCLFMLLSLFLFIKYNTLKKRITYLGSIFCFILSLLSKEITIVFPLLLILYDYYFLNEKDKTSFLNKIKTRYLSFFLVVVIYTILRLTILNFPAEEAATLKAVNPYFRLLTAAKVFFVYLKLLFVPLGLHMERTIKVPEYFLEPAALISAIGLALLLVLTVKLRKKSKIASFGLSWFFINLIPVSNILPLNAFLAEHWLYIPSIGFLLAVGVIAERLINEKREILRKLAMASFALIFLFYCVLTIARNFDWRDNIAFYLKTLKYAPNSARIYYNLGNEYFRLEQLDKAMELYQEAFKINPNYADAYNNLGSIYYEKGKLDKAIETFNRAIEINPNNAKYYNNLGSAYAEKKLFNEAKTNWKKAIELDPTRSSAGENLKKLEQFEY